MSYPLHMTQMTAGAIPAFTLADRLRKAREHAGLDQTQLAALVGVSRVTVSKYETGAPTRPAAVRLWALATGVDREWLETGESPHPDGPGEGIQRPQPESNWQPTGYPTAQVRALPISRERRQWSAA